MIVSRMDRFSDEPGNQKNQFINQAKAEKSEKSENHKNQFQTYNHEKSELQAFIKNRFNGNG